MTFLNISPSDKIMVIVIIAIVGLVVVIFLVRFIIRKTGESKFMKLAEELTEQVNTHHPHDALDVCMV